MASPNHVPNVVRAFAKRLLDGIGEDEHTGVDGWRQAIRDADKTIRQIKKCQRRQLDANPLIASVLDDLRITLKNEEDRRAQLVADVDCLERLVNDPRMQAAYMNLVGANLTDVQMEGFIFEAWGAQRTIFEDHRNRAKAATELASEIAKSAATLADQLHKAETFGGPSLPLGFRSIRSLIERTEWDQGDRKFLMWPAMWRANFDDNPNAETIPHSEWDEALPACIAVQNALDEAPSMARIITTLQRVAADYVPAMGGHIGAALKSRKKTSKTAYLRGFITLLQSNFGIGCTPATINAIAITATVALNEQAIDVTTDDVRKARDSLAS